MSQECNSMPFVCETCRDLRFVTLRPEARRRVDGGGTADVYPCPVCGQFVTDSDGKKYGVPGKRYGNPFLTGDWEYVCWKARNADKTQGWTSVPPSGNEVQEIGRLAASFGQAKPEWIRAWVLGNRRVLEGAA